MRESTIARNYAEALVELAKRAKDLRGWGALIQSIADAMNRDEKLRTFLETPRVDAGTKNAILRRALSDRAPAKFVRFVESVVTHRRQMLIPEIARAYVDLVDEAENRMHANVTVARDADGGVSPEDPTNCLSRRGSEELILVSRRQLEVTLRFEKARRTAPSS